MLCSIQIDQVAGLLSIFSLKRKGYDRFFFSNSSSQLENLSVLTIISSKLGWGSPLAVSLRIDTTVDAVGEWFDIKLNGYSYIKGLRYPPDPNSSTKHPLVRGQLITLSWNGLANANSCVEFFENSAQTIIPSSTGSVSRYLSAGNGRIFIESQNRTLRQPQVIHEAEFVRLELYRFPDGHIIPEHTMREVDKGNKEPEFAIWGDVISKATSLYGMPHPRGAAQRLRHRTTQLPEFRSEAICGVYGDFGSLFQLKDRLAEYIQQTHYGAIYLPAPYTLTTPKNAAILETLLQVCLES